MELPIKWVFHLIILVSIRFEHHAVLAAGPTNGTPHPSNTPQPSTTPQPSAQRHPPVTRLSLLTAVVSTPIQEVSALTPYYQFPPLSAMPHSPTGTGNALGLSFFTQVEIGQIQAATARNSPVSATNRSLPPGPQTAVLPPLLMPVPQQLHHLTTAFLTHSPRRSRQTRSSTSVNSYRTALPQLTLESEPETFVTAPPPVNDMFVHNFHTVNPGGHPTPPPTYAGIRRGVLVREELIGLTPYGLEIINAIE